MGGRHLGLGVDDPQPPVLRGGLVKDGQVRGGLHVGARARAAARQQTRPAASASRAFCLQLHPQPPPAVPLPAEGALARGQHVLIGGLAEPVVVDAHDPIGQVHPLVRPHQRRPPARAARRARPAATPPQAARVQQQSSFHALRAPSQKKMASPPEYSCRLRV